MHHQGGYLFRSSRRKRAILERAGSDRQAADKAKDDERREEQREEIREDNDNA